MTVKTMTDSSPVIAADLAHELDITVVPPAFKERVSLLLPGIRPPVLKPDPAPGVHGGPGTLVVGLGEGEGW